MIIIDYEDTNKPYTTTKLKIPYKELLYIMFERKAVYVQTKISKFTLNLNESERNILMFTINHDNIMEIALNAGMMGDNSGIVYYNPKNGKIIQMETKTQSLHPHPFTKTIYMSCMIKFHKKHGKREFIFSESEEPRVQ